jgi:glutamate---cysteine ligase / carboxylate-amine ligase
MGDADIRPTFGVEEEFLLVDKESGRPVPCAPGVLARAGGAQDAAPGAVFQPEFLATQVEAASGVCTDLEELRGQLRASRARLAGAAQAEGARLLSVGAPVLEGPAPPPAGEPRYLHIADCYAGAMVQYQACGCHVHVAVPDRESAVAVVNRLRPWLPTLLALSANSPFERGRDTGCQSWRAVLQSRFPSSGVPPLCASAADYQERLAALVACGALMDERMTFWHARPSPHLPTVEIRAADAALAVDDALLQAALSRAMVCTALREHREGRPVPRVHDSVAAAAVWAAARHGMEGPAVDPERERRVPAALRVGELLTWITPALEESGDLPAVRALLGATARRGTGATRQRRAAADGGTRALLDLLDTRTASLSRA